jgi:hypothetical protein
VAELYDLDVVPGAMPPMALALVPPATKSRG